MRRITLPHEAINHIELVRASKQMTRHETAVAAGIAPTTYNAFVQGRSQPRFETVLAICQALGMDIYFRRTDITPGGADQ